MSRTPTRADGTPVTGPEVREVMQDTTQPTFVGKPPPSQTFVAILSIIVGLIIGLGTIVGVLGGAFFVRRSEYTERIIKDSEEATTTRNALQRVEKALERQEASFERLSEAVQAIKVDMVRRRGQ